jgi:hypothetical protein
VTLPRELSLPNREPPAERLSYPEFLEWLDDSWAEWVDGRVIPRTMPVERRKAGVPEYVLVDPEAPSLEARLLGRDGRYRLAFAGASGLYRSAVLPRLCLRVEWLWQDPGPDMAEVLRTIEGDADEN